MSHKFYVDLSVLDGKDPGHRPRTPCTYWFSTETGWTGCRPTNSYNNCTLLESYETTHIGSTERLVVFRGPFDPLRSGRVASPR